MPSVVVMDNVSSALFRKVMSKRSSSGAKWTIILSSNADINTSAFEVCEKKIEATESTAIESFKDSDDYKNLPQSCLALGVTREQAKSLDCDCVLIDIPTCLLLESTDFHSCSEMMATHLVNVKETQQTFAALTVVILETYEDAFKDSLQQHLTGKNVDVKLSNSIDYNNTSWDGFAGVAIISNAHLKSNLICIETNSFQLINIIPVRSNTEAISTAKSLPYKSRLSLWTESANLTLVAWNELSFGTVSVNNFDSITDDCDLFFNGKTVSNGRLNTIAEPFGLPIKPTEKKIAAKYAVRFSMKAPIENSRSDVCSKLTGSPAAVERMLNWCSNSSNFHKVWKAVPIEKLQVGIEVQTTDELIFIAVAMAICDWNSVIVACPNKPKDLDQLCEDFLLLEINLATESDIFAECDCVFTPYEKEPNCAKKCFGSLKGCDLIQYLAYETSTVKHLVIPLSKLTC